VSASPNLTRLQAGSGFVHIPAFLLVIDGSAAMRTYDQGPPKSESPVDDSESYFFLVADFFLVVNFFTAVFLLAEDFEAAFAVTFV
jgi:hypothetical protein